MAAKLPQGEALAPVVDEQRAGGALAGTDREGQGAETGGPAGGEMRVHGGGDCIRVQGALLLPDELAPRIQQVGRRRASAVERPLPASAVVLRQDQSSPKPFT